MDIKEPSVLLTDHPTNKHHLNFQATCLNNNPSSLACNNTKCSEYAFVCSNKNCQCRSPHKKCLFTCTQKILQLIQQKRAESTDVIDKISLVLDKWIDQISKTREKIQDMLLDWGLSGSEKKFIQIIQNQHYKQLTGNHIYQITSQTIGYFSEETKQRLFLQIQRVEQNYDAQIKSITKSVMSLFEKYQIQQKDISFTENKEIKIDLEYQFMTEFHEFRNKELKKQTELKLQDYEKTINFMKIALKKDFQAHLNRFRRNRRAYGTKKLREKYFEDYFEILIKGNQYLKKWQTDTAEHMKYINRCYEKQLKELSRYYHQADALVEKPFTAQMALSLQKTINVIEMLTDFAKTKGKNQMQFLKDKDKTLGDNFLISIYFLDEIMDEHPQIDEMEVVWNVIRFSEKIKEEINLLFDTLNEAKNQVYSYELN